MKFVGVTSLDLQRAIREVIDEILEERREEIVKRAHIKLKKRKSRKIISEPTKL